MARLMRAAAIQGVYRRRRGGCTLRDRGAELAEDLVMRQFNAEAPNELWVSDVTEHPTDRGKVYLAVVLDAWSRMVIGWSIADHIRSELVVDALQMAIWRRRPTEGKTVCHTDHGRQYTSWALGRRLRAAGLLGSMGSIGDCFDNSLAESFFGTLQLELLDRHHWQTRDQLASAIFEYVEALSRPPPPALLDRQPQPCGVRVPTHGHRRCGMITEADLSGRPGQAHCDVTGPRGHAQAAVVREGLSHKALQVIYPKEYTGGPSLPLDSGEYQVEWAIDSGIVKQVLMRTRMTIRMEQDGELHP